MSWEIVLGIIALIGVFGTVAGWASKLSGTLAKLEAAIQTLNKTLDRIQADSKENMDKVNGRLDDHERRLTILETTGGDCGCQ